MIDSFQGEITKRILHFPKWYSNTAAIVALGWKSLHSICTRKLRFLHRVMTNQENICHHAFSAMADNIESLSLVRECRELELRYNSTFTSAILCAMEQEKVNIIRNAQRNICKIDQSLLLQKASTYPLIPNSDCQVCWMEKALGQCTWSWTLSYQGLEEPRSHDHTPQLFSKKMSTLWYTELGPTNSDWSCYI